MSGRSPDSSPDEGLFHASVSIGRVAGVEIGINWSWLLIVGVMVASLATTVFPQQNRGLSDATYAEMAVAGVLLFFASLLAHELGHAIQARREGVEIEASRCGSSAASPASAACSRRPARSCASRSPVRS